MSGKNPGFSPNPTSISLSFASSHHASFNETFQFLFWTMFGMEEHTVVDMPQFLVPEFVGRALYGIFTIVMVIVLLNMLIAMITNSFQKIEVGKLSQARPDGGNVVQAPWVPALPQYCFMSLDKFSTVQEGFQYCCCYCQSTGLVLFALFLVVVVDDGGGGGGGSLEAL